MKEHYGTTFIDTSRWMTRHNGYLLVDPGCTDLDYGSKCAMLQACFKAVLKDTGPVVVDLANALYLDSSALGLILSLQKDLENQARMLAVVAPSGEVVANLLALTRLNGILNCFQTREDALEAIL